jgi:hypothetical protein
MEKHINKMRLFLQMSLAEGQWQNTRLIIEGSNMIERRKSSKLDRVSLNLKSKLVKSGAEIARVNGP